jgi:hypothetical protein
MKKTLFKQGISRTLLMVPVLAAVMFAASEMGIYGQGFYNNNPGNASPENEGSGGSGNSSGNGNGLRAGGNENTQDGGQATKVPIEDGWGILLIGGIGYGLYIAKRKKQGP